MTSFLFLVIFFMRGYMHYIGQYFILKVKDIAISKFEIYSCGIDIEYQAPSVQASVEFGVVLAGPAANMIIFFVMVNVASFCQWWLDNFPAHGCRFIAAWGIMAMLDVLIVAALDLLRGNTTYGDIFKLYVKFDKEEGSGVTGVFCTFTSYCIVIAYQAIMLFYYLLRIHMNGHMQDIYARLRGT